MKKILMMAAFAAAGAAFTACSSDDTLATQQTPEAPVVKGTPFKVSAFAEGTTRATRYNSDAWGTDGTSEKVTMFKLYGKRGGEDEPWMNNAIFTRDANSTDWAPIRDQKTAALSVINWPTEDTETPTPFYAITDNAFGSGDAIANISEWMTTVGSLVYKLPTKTSNILWYTNNGYGQEDLNEYTYVDDSKLTDVMVASKNTNEEDCNGTVALDFKHILGGFKISAMFVSEAEKGNNTSATVKSVMVCGLDGVGTYTFGATTPWSTSTKVNYYYELPTSIVFNAEAESGTHTPVDLFAHGTWLALPQTTTAWDELVTNGGYPTTGAYIALRIYDSTYESDYILCYPLTITIEAAKSKKIVINIADGRDVFGGEDTNEPGKAAHFYTPASSIVI